MQLQGKVVGHIVFIEAIGADKPVENPDKGGNSQAPSIMRPVCQCSVIMVVEGVLAVRTRQTGPFPLTEEWPSRPTPALYDPPAC